MPYVIGGLVGFALGIFLHKYIIDLACDSVPPTICDYCHQKAKREMKRKGRHKL